MDTVEVAGLQIAYERVGSGPALVLLHGYVGDGPTTWRPQRDRLSDEFTVVAWDAPGAGRSNDPPEQFGLDRYADCLAGFLEKLGLDTACVAGLSFGGILALALQRRHSAVSSALILTSAYAGWAGSLPPAVAEQRLRQALTLADGAPEAFVDALLPTMFSKTMPRETVDDFRATMQAFHPRGFRAMARASAEDVRDVLPRVGVPTFLVYGDRDVRAPLTVAEALQAAIPGSRLVVLPDAGHICTSKLRTSSTWQPGTFFTRAAAGPHARRRSRSRRLTDSAPTRLRDVCSSSTAAVAQSGTPQPLLPPCDSAAARGPSVPRAVAIRPFR
jgi:pimeloyl-ACP methyl ester carboxylesterase